MRLRYQLLYYFMAVIIVAVFLFGWSSYRISHDATLKRENELLRSHITQQAALLSATNALNGDLGKLENTLLARNDGKTENESGHKSHDEAYINIITTAQGSPVVPADPNIKFHDVIGDLNIPSLFNNDSNKGQLTINNNNFTWMRTPISDSDYQLLYIIKSRAGSHSSALLQRLIVSAFIILWISVWVALVISTRVSRKFQAQADEIEYQALHDSLTEFPNRLWLQRKLDDEIKKASVSNKSIALIMIDLDKFKNINDTLGHAVGDALLQEVGESLKSCLWESDSIARMGGDEFAILMPITDDEHCYIAIDKILNEIEKPILIDGIPLEIRASLGVAMYPAHGKDASSLIRCAEVAMYLSKQKSNPYAIYDPALDPHSVELLQITGDLRHAAERDQLTLYYQPKMDIASSTITGAEALLRWEHPDRGFISPEEFIPLAEQSGAIVSLTDWVLNEAIEKAAQWYRQNISLCISINLSARLLHDLDLPKKIIAILDKYNLPHNRIEMEITETAIIKDPEDAYSILRRLHASGIRISIDDFGKGYTSLSQLRHMPFNEIKIDKSFVLNMMSDNNDAVIVKSIIDLAHNTGHEVIAEGVEDNKTLAELERLGCDTIQGYYLCRPIPAHQFEEWLQLGHAQDNPELSCSPMQPNLNTA